MNRRLAEVLSLLVFVTLWHVASAMSQPVELSFTSLDPRFDTLVSTDAKLEKIADGFTWVEGPVWNKEGGYLLFSDIPANVVFKWKSDEGVTRVIERSGYSGATPFRGHEPGSNGLTYDAHGRLFLCRHGDRQIGRLEADGTISPIATGFDGHRLNSPNDLVFKSNGDLYFTDPPFGLPGAFDDPDKAPVQGVYRVAGDGTITRVISSITAPNGIAFSPDEKRLYVSDVDPLHAAWLVFDVRDDGTVTNGQVLFDAARWRQDPFFGPDGLKIDEHGNLWGARPGGISVIAPSGTLLGLIEIGRSTSNVAWGEDGRTLFIASAEALFRLRVKTKGTGY